jgi:hypothetical protein
MKALSCHILDSFASTRNTCAPRDFSQAADIGPAWRHLCSAPSICFSGWLPSKMCMHRKQTLRTHTKAPKAKSREHTMFTTGCISRRATMKMAKAKVNEMKGVMSVQVQPQPVMNDVAHDLTQPTCLPESPLPRAVGL